MPRKLKRPASWIDNLEKTDVEAAIDDAMIDAYGDDEHHSALLTLVGDRLVFPFRARVMGNDIIVIAMEWPDDNSFGLYFVCKDKKSKHLIEAQSLELWTPYPEGYIYLAAYLEWKKHN